MNAENDTAPSFGVHNNRHPRAGVSSTTTRTRSPSPSSRIAASKNHSSPSFGAANAYMAKTVSISRPSSAIRSRQVADTSRNPSPARMQSSKAVNPLEQFKLAASLGNNKSKSAANVVSSKYRPRASSESPLRSTQSPLGTYAPAASYRMSNARGRQLEVNRSRSSSVPRRHPMDESSSHRQPPVANRFSSLVSERREQYDRQARGRSPASRQGHQHPLDSARDFHQKVGLVRPMTAGPTMPDRRERPSNQGLPNYQGATTTTQSATARPTPSQLPKKDPEVVTFKKDPEPATRPSIQKRQPQGRHESPQEQASVTVPSEATVESRPNAARYEKSIIHKMLSEKRTTKHQVGASAIDVNSTKQTEPKQEAAVTTTKPASARATLAEPPKRAAPQGVRSYGFAERLSNQLARSETDRKQSIGSNTPSSVASPAHTVHPVFGYSKPDGKRSVAQSRDPKVESSAAAQTLGVQRSDSLDDQLEIDDEIDPSDESDLSCVRRSKHLNRVMRPHSSSLVRLESPVKRKVETAANYSRQQHQRQREVSSAGQDVEQAHTKRIRAATTSPKNRRIHTYEERAFSAGKHMQTEDVQRKQDGFAIGQMNRNAKSTRRNYSRQYDNVYVTTAQGNQSNYGYARTMDSRRSGFAEKPHGFPSTDADLYYDEYSDQDYSDQYDRPGNDSKREQLYHDVSEHPPYNTASQLHNDLERRQPSSVSNREPGGVYGADDVSSFMRVAEPPGPIDPPDPQTENTGPKRARKHRTIVHDKGSTGQYESFRSLEERRRHSQDAPSGRSFLGTQSSTDASSQQASTVDNSESSRGESALGERAQNEQALEDLLHEKAKRMGRRHSEAMDESSDSRADAFKWLHQKYGPKAPTMNAKAIEKAKARALNAKVDSSQKKTEMTSPILEDDEDIFSGLDDMSSFSRRASPAPSPKNEVAVSRVAKSPKITVRTMKEAETPKDEKNSVKTFQEALFSNTIISDLTTSLVAEKRRMYPKSPSKPPTVFSEIEEVPSNDDSTEASQNGCKRTTSAVTGLGQTIGKSIVASIQRASCNVPEKIPVPRCDVDKARCEHRINEAWGISNDDKDSLISAGDNSTVTDTMLNEMEKRIWAAWDRRRSKPSDESPGVSAPKGKPASETTNLHVDTASTASSENKDEGVYDRAEAKQELMQVAQKAVEMYGSQFPHTASLAKLHSTDSSTHRPKPIVSLAVGTPVSKLSTTMTFEDQAMLESFSSALKNTGVEVLKLGRKNKWQVRYLTVSKEVTKLSTGGVAGDIGQCPMALLWPKSFKGHNFSVATIKENGRGGVLFRHLKKVRPTASNEYYDHHLPKKLKSTFPEFAGVVLDYLHDGGARQLHLCFKSNAEAQAFITAMLIIREATERSECDDSFLHDEADFSCTTNSLEESEH